MRTPYCVDGQRLSFWCWRVAYLVEVFNHQAQVSDDCDIAVRGGVFWASLVAESLTKHDHHQISESEETWDLGCVMAEDGVLGARVDGCHMPIFLLYAQTAADLWHVDGWGIGRVNWSLGTLSAAIGTR